MVRSSKLIQLTLAFLLGLTLIWTLMLGLGTNVVLSASLSQDRSHSISPRQTTKDFRRLNGMTDTMDVILGSSLAAVITQASGVETADLEISKTTSPPPIRVGFPFTYEIVVTNFGSPASSVRITDILPSSVALHALNPGPDLSCSFNVTNSLVTCEQDTLKKMKTITVSIVVSPTVAGEIPNVAKVSSDNSGTTKIVAITTTVEPVANLIINKRDDPDPVLAGAPLTYTLTITNDGPSTATQVRITDTLPVGFEFDSYSALPSVDCHHLNGVVTCTMLDLPLNNSIVVSIQVIPTIVGVGVNKVEVSSAAIDRFLQDNITTETTLVNPATDLAISKSAIPAPAFVGLPLTYTVVVTNLGPLSPTLLLITDMLPDGVDFHSISPSESCVYSSGRVTCTLTDLALDQSPGVTIVVTPTLVEAITNVVKVQGGISDCCFENNIYTKTTAVEELKAVESVIISGPTVGFVNTPYTFTAVVSPPEASRPISYSWLPEPDSGQGTPTVVYTWKTIDTMTTVVFAENAGGSDDDIHSIDIIVPVTDWIYLPIIFKKYSSIPTLIVKTHALTVASIEDTVHYTFTVKHTEDSADTPACNITLNYRNFTTSMTIEDGGGGCLEKGEVATYTTSYTIGRFDPDPLTSTISVAGTNIYGSKIPLASDTHIIEFICANNYFHQKDMFDISGGWVTGKVGDAIYFGPPESPGKYTILSKKNFYLYSVAPFGSFNQYTVKVQGSRIDPPPGGAYGIIFGVKDKENSLVTNPSAYLYRFVVRATDDPPPGFHWNRYDGSIFRSVDDIIGSSWLESMRIKTGALSNTLEVRCYDTEAAVYANGHLLWKHNSLPVSCSGEVGVVYFPDGQLEKNTNFDNFEICGIR